MSTSYANRRADLLARLPAGAVAIIAGAHEVRRNLDSHYRFRQPSDLYYLTGLAEPEALAVLAAPGAAGHAGAGANANRPPAFTLFLRPRDPHKETWNGRRAGLVGGREQFSADQSFDIAELEPRLFELLDGATEVHMFIGDDPQIDAMVARIIANLRRQERNGRCAPRHIVDIGGSLHELRLRKDAEALVRMRRAAAITVEAHLLAMHACRAGRHEYEIEALIEYVFRRHNGLPGYGSILGAGANATILHYTDNRDLLHAGELLLADAGCEWDGFTADVTRTYPIAAAGQPARFSLAQRKLYDVVLAAQLAGIASARPGSTIEEIHKVCTRELTSGLVALGLLHGDVDELIASGAQKRYYLHRSSHWLGMDVHDVGSYFPGGEPRLLLPGMVLTIEPGLYIRTDDDCPPEYRGLGIRIEDDILITEAGHEVLTAELPKQAQELEALAGTGATISL
jgi:Xaa-Pro aminopeptidase